MMSLSIPKVQFRAFGYRGNATVMTPFNSEGPIQRYDLIIWDQGENDFQFRRSNSEVADNAMDPVLKRLSIPKVQFRAGDF